MLGVMIYNTCCAKQKKQPSFFNLKKMIQKFIFQFIMASFLSRLNKTTKKNTTTIKKQKN